MEAQTGLIFLMTYLTYQLIAFCFTPNETLFAGTDVGVFYKDSSMTNWEYFNQGLPNVIVTELEYHINSNGCCWNLW